ncbi:MAG: PLP-dependent aminotransferase family protein [Clostridia bacterium]|nr:PLP-dependent aminotransferase family protein [Clostridia bacterium]
MKYHVNEKGQSAYIQLYNQLKEDLISKAYPFGAKLPSKRLLAEETGLSVITVEHAYNLLIEEGYVATKERSGYFVIYKEDDFLSKSSANNFDLNYQPLPVQTPSDAEVETSLPFSVLSKTIRKVVLDQGKNLLVKCENNGLFCLRREICSYLKRAVGINATPEQVVVGAGAEYLYGLIVQLLGTDQNYGVENPSHEKIKQVYQAHGATCIPLDMGVDGIKSGKLKNAPVSVLHVTPYNSFPSGVTASASKRREYLQWSSISNGFIVEDNYDSELTISKKHEETLFSLSNGSRVIYLNTLSKTLSPGMRLGYMILPPELTKKFALKLGFYSCTVPVFEQYLLSELLSSGDFERHVNRVRRQKRKK